MSTPHRAKPRQWTALQEASALSASSCILELRDRVEALEAATRTQQHGKAAAPGDSLVERVQDAIDKARPDYDTAMARAAIREVAAWLRSEHIRSVNATAPAWANMIDLEATRCPANEPSAAPGGAGSRP